MGTLTDDMTRLVGEIGTLRNTREAFVSDLKRDVAEMQEGFRDAHEEMAERTKTGLKEFVSDLGANVGEMQEGFRNAHEEMAKTMKDDLGMFVTDLKADVAQMQAGFNHDHAEMGEKLRDDLGTFVSDLRQKTTGLRKEFAADIAGARRAWFGPTPAGHRAMEEDKLRAKEEEMRKAKLLPDDLTAIQGIGPAIQKRLNEAGIYTYRQLATNSQKLKDTLGKLGKVVDVENWIDQARELAELR